MRTASEEAHTDLAPAPPTVPVIVIRPPPGTSTRTLARPGPPALAETTVNLEAATGLADAPVSEVDGTSTKLTVTSRPTLTSTLQTTLVPEQAPPHDENLDPTAAVAVRVTRLPDG